jgi:hypothetical protein
MPKKSKFFIKNAAENNSNASTPTTNAPANSNEGSIGGVVGTALSNRSAQNNVLNNRSANNQNSRVQENPLGFLAGTPGQINPKLNYYSLLFPYVLLALSSSPVGLLLGNIFLNPRVWRNANLLAGDTPMFTSPLPDFPPNLGRRAFLETAQWLPLLLMQGGGGNIPALIPFNQQTTQLPTPREIAPRQERG